MGFFSWMTMDTSESISNVYSERGPLPVKVLVPNRFSKELGSFIEEKEYDGYGIFGGYDIYELVAKWNRPDAPSDEDGFSLRNLGIDIACLDAYHKQLDYPIRIVSLDFDGTYEDLNGFSKGDEAQGYFY